MAKELLQCKFHIEETKADSDSEYAYFTGYGSTFGNIDQANDIVEFGAFADTLAQKQKVPMLWQHDYKQPIGLFKNMREDSQGLIVEGEINKSTRLGMEAYSLLKQGALDGLSIGFRTKEWSYNSDKEIRVIKKVDLFEISLVTFPCNVKATATDIKCFIKSPKIDKMTIKDFERWLRDELQCSHKTAKRLAVGGYKTAIENRDDSLGGVNELDSLKAAIDEAFKSVRI